MSAMHAKRMVATMLVVMGSASLAAAQSRTFEVEAAAGPLVESNFAANNGSSSGQVLRLGVFSRKEGSGKAFRLDVEGLTGLEQISIISPKQRRSYAATALYNAMFGPKQSDLWPYAVIGGGLLFDLSNRPDSYPGFYPTARAGAGIRKSIGAVTWSAELTAVWYARDFGKPVYWPLTVGVSF